MLLAAVKRESDAKNAEYAANESAYANAPFYDKKGRLVSLAGVKVKALKPNKAKAKKLIAKAGKAKAQVAMKGLAGDMGAALPDDYLDDAFPVVPVVAGAVVLSILAAVVLRMRQNHRAGWR